MEKLQNHWITNPNSCSTKFRQHTIKAINILGIFLLTFIGYGCESPHLPPCKECINSLDGKTIMNEPLCLSECDMACADGSELACNEAKRTRIRQYEDLREGCHSDDDDALFICLTACLQYLNNNDNYLSSLDPDIRLNNECCKKYNNRIEANFKKFCTGNEKCMYAEAEYKKKLEQEQLILKELTAKKERERLELEAKKERERELDKALREAQYRNSPRGECESDCNDAFTRNSQSWRYCMMNCKDKRSY